jgi:hypothetical protein
MLYALCVPLKMANFFMDDAFSWEMGRPYFRFLRETVYST